MAAAARFPQAQAGAAALPRRGGLVALEGIDGSGKSSLARHLGQRLEAAGVPTVLTREPTDSWVGQAVRRSIREHGDPFQDAFLFLADHAAHVAEVKGWLAEGRTVLTDRWADSCLAYQSAALEPRLGPGALAWLEEAQRPVTLRPDAVLLLDLAPEQALARIQQRPELVKFEQREFLAQVRRNYLDLAKRRGYDVLDATRPAPELLDHAWRALQRQGIAP